ncbi:hypothetical protein KC340_g3963 [Hortaea werneckii]|nr:hypothetical protein KC342_g5008 [Hortaea werneckii]KAI7101162.1 hypothetical protein KC339_g6928 [Hortaea werneckii]KAI7225053.1 hypothetical protein KC365_g10236 [Hortaea werneckii]KAI7331103.1 hypothetical protein KC340_g3963 [Hortaea werneckii]KAI7395922.1 hypothetical protein KC328_g5543 [Hortaea werneckii]
MDNAARAALRRQNTGFGPEPASYNGLSYSAFQDDTVPRPSPVWTPNAQKSPRTAATLRQQHHASSNDRERLAQSVTQHQLTHLTSHHAPRQAHSQAPFAAKLKPPEVREVIAEDTPQVKKRRSISVAVKETVARPKHEATRVRFEPDTSEATPVPKKKQTTSLLRKAASAPKKAFQWYTGRGPRPPRGPAPPPWPAAVSTTHYGLMARAAKSSPNIITGTPADFTSLDLDREYRVRAQTPRSMAATPPLTRPDQAYIRPMGLMRSAHEADMYAMRRREFERTLDGAVQEALEKRPPPRKYTSYARATTPPVSGPGGAPARVGVATPPPPPPPQIRSYSTPTVPGWSLRSPASLPTRVSPWTSQPTVVGTSSPTSRSQSPFLKLQSPQYGVGSSWSSSPHTQSISAAYAQSSGNGSSWHPWTGSPVSSPPTTPGYTGMIGTAVQPPCPAVHEEAAVPWSRGEQVLALAQGQRQPASLGPNGKTFQLFGTNTYRGTRYFSSPHDPLKPQATTPPRAEDWRQNIPVFAHRPEQVSHFADRPLSEDEKNRLRRGDQAKEEEEQGRRENRPKIPRAFTAPANLPSQNDEEVPLQVLRDGKLRNRLLKRMTRDRHHRGKTPSPATLVAVPAQQGPTTGRYDAHSAASSNQSRQPSISSVMLGETVAAAGGASGGDVHHGFLDAGYTRRESFAPGECGRPTAAAARYRRAGRGNLTRKSGVCDLKTRPGLASPSPRDVDGWTSGSRPAGKTTGPAMSKSDLGSLESREQDNQTPFRLKPQGSLASLDYGRISGTGVLANRVSSIAGSLRRRDQSPDSVSYPPSIPPPASQGPNNNTPSHNHDRSRVEDFYAAHRVRERLDRISRICGELLTRHGDQQLPRRYQDLVLSCMEERRMVEDWGMEYLWNLAGPPSPTPPQGKADQDRRREGSGSDSWPADEEEEEEEEAGRFQSFRHMLRSLEREVERVREEIIQGTVLEQRSSTASAFAEGDPHIENERPRSRTNKLRRARTFLQPMMIEDAESGEGDDSDTESKLKGSGAKRSLSTNF